MIPAKTHASCLARLSGTEPIVFGGFSIIARCCPNLVTRSVDVADQQQKPKMTPFPKGLG